MENRLGATPIEECLDQVIGRELCVLCYDRNLVDLLPEILLENHGIAEDADIRRLPELTRLFDMLGAGPEQDRHIADLPKLITAGGIDLSKYSTRSAAERTSRFAPDFEHWSEKSVTDSVDAVISLQKDLGMGAHNSMSKRYEARKHMADLRNYLRSVTTPPPTLIERVLRRSFWELKLRQWLSRGVLMRDVPSLSVGPRWITEIEFFREIVGLQKHIGLDLFSDNSELVTAGDMHKMPFGDGYFQFIFLKNVVDKSYDIRKLVCELIRVLRPGGIVVIDQICGYGSTNPLTRTDIQRAENLARIFDARAKFESLVCDNVDISGIGDSAGTNESRYNARLALRLK